MTTPDPLRLILEAMLDRVVERVGDRHRGSTAAVRSRPIAARLFVNDPRGSVRGEMFHRAVEALLDVAGDRPTRTA
jgi:hypothetical protein